MVRPFYFQRRTNIYHAIGGLEVKMWARIKAKLCALKIHGTKVRYAYLIQCQWCGTTKTDGAARGLVKGGWWF